MKKRIILFVLIVAIIVGLFGCSEKAEKNIPLPIEYSYEQNYDNVDIVYDPDSVINYEEYSDRESEHKGLIAEIVPEEYIYYYVVSDENRVNGYAECRCKITNISEKYNNTEYKVGDIIYVRQFIFLEALNYIEVLKMYKSIGAIKNFKAVEGVYKANNKLINGNDYKLLIQSPTVVLTEGQPCYASINIDNSNGILYLGNVCYKNDDYNQNIPKDTPSDILLGILFLKEFLSENDKNMLK